MSYDPDLADRLRELLRPEHGITEKKMFGGLAFLINGHMAVSASGQGGLLLRVDPADTESLVAKPHAERFKMRGRAIDGWVRVSEAGFRTDKELAAWVKTGLTYASSLAPKR